MMVFSDKFYQAARVSLYDTRLSGTEVRIYGVLCDRVYGNTNEVTINRNFILKAVGCSKKTFLTAITHLMDYGYITRKRRNFDNTGAEKSPTYFLASFEEVKAQIDEACAWVFNTATDVVEKEPEEVIEAPIEEVKEETKVVRKPIKRTLKKVEKPTTPSTEKKPTSKPVFSRGYENTTHTNIPGKNDPLTAWSGYDGTALAERDKTRGPLKGGKRVYTVLGQKFPMVMQEDGETVNLFASEVKTFSPTVMRYFKIPHYTAEQWADIKKGAKRA